MFNLALFKCKRKMKNLNLKTSFIGSDIAFPNMYLFEDEKNDREVYVVGNYKYLFIFDTKTKFSEFKKEDINFSFRVLKKHTGKSIAFINLDDCIVASYGYGTEYINFKSQKLINFFLEFMFTFANSYHDAEISFERSSSNLKYRIQRMLHKKYDKEYFLRYSSKE